MFMNLPTSQEGDGPGLWKGEEELLGLPYTVRDRDTNSVKVVSVGGKPDPVTLPGSFMDVLREWGNTVWR